MKNIFGPLLFLTVYTVFMGILSCDQNKPMRIFDPSTAKQAANLEQTSQNNASGSTSLNRKEDDQEVQEAIEKKPKSAIDYEDEDTECEEIYDGTETVLICWPVGTEAYFFPRLRGDHWGVGRATLEYFSTNNLQYTQGAYLWRSSYGALAPLYDRYGNPLFRSCLNCVRVPHYDDYTYLATYFDDGLYYWENGYWTDNYAYSYFTAPKILNMCGYDNALSSLMKSITNVAIGSLSATVYNVLDLTNQARYGCPYGYNTNVCYYGR